MSRHIRPTTLALASMLRIRQQSMRFLLEAFENELSHESEGFSLITIDSLVMIAINDLDKPALLAARFGHQQAEVFFLQTNVQACIFGWKRNTKTFYQLCRVSDKPTVP